MFSEFSYPMRLVVMPDSESGKFKTVAFKLQLSEEVATTAVPLVIHVTKGSIFVGSTTNNVLIIAIWPLF